MCITDGQRPPRPGGNGGQGRVRPDRDALTTTEVTLGEGVTEQGWWFEEETAMPPDGRKQLSSVTMI